MSDESGSIWQALLSSGEYIATDADYEHGYDRPGRTSSES